MSAGNGKEAEDRGGRAGRGGRGRRQQQHGPGLGPPGLIGSGEKAKDFKGSFKRLVGRLRSTGCAGRGREARPAAAAYFDGHARGDVLSAGSPTTSTTSADAAADAHPAHHLLLTVVGVLAMMFWISPAAGGHRLLTVPLSVVVTMLIAKRSQKQFAPSGSGPARSTATSRRCTPGTRPREGVRTPGRAIEQFDERERALYEASFKAQFISGIIQPAMMFISNLNYVRSP
jgi:ATP-binding cassette, subfamily B, multidrug efflux pump